jgi:hypothetical protein
MPDKTRDRADGHRHFRNNKRKSDDEILCGTVKTCRIELITGTKILVQMDIMVMCDKGMDSYLRRYR